MCGIIGIIDSKPVTQLLVSSLKRLEYRGYDSAGLATIDHNAITIVRAKGKIAALEQKLQTMSVNGNIGIAHTRWATHGQPSEVNAHPHSTKKLAVVHNGIIENYRKLRAELIAKGCSFTSDTDTEVIPHLINLLIEQGLAPLEAVQQSVKMLEGAFAIAVIIAGYDNMIIGARKGAPLAVGYGQDAMYLGSDSYALAPLTSRICYLDEGDVVAISRDKAIIYDHHDQVVERPIKVINSTQYVAGKGNHRHFMLKEIYEQPQIAHDVLELYLDLAGNSLKESPLPLNFTNIPKITLIACGTSYYASMIAKHWFESVAKIPAEVELASEFRYRDQCLPQGGLAIFVSQSGETADTLAALRYAKSLQQHTLAIVNVAESSMAREANFFLEIHAGPEVSVASTKGFTAQLITLACLVLQAAKAKNLLDNLSHYISELASLPSKMSGLLDQESSYMAIAKKLITAKSIIYVGRGTSYVIAMEGALKLKELSYIHAEGIASGELKHGTIALIDHDMPIIAIAPKDQLFDKTVSNLQEIAARGGNIITISDKESNKELAYLSSDSIDVLNTDPFVAPMLYPIPLQLLAYYTAFFKGTDIDQPRNLAKSVTVE